MEPQELLSRLSAPPLPLRLDENGAIRVGDTRVTLETVLIQFQQGSSPEMIALSFPTLRLEEVYTLLAYYLHNRALLDEYLQSARQEADQWFAQLERSKEPLPGVIVVPREMPIGQAVSELELIVSASLPNELEARVIRLPISL